MSPCVLLLFVPVPDQATAANPTMCECGHKTLVVRLLVSSSISAVHCVDVLSVVLQLVGGASLVSRIIQFDCCSSHSRRSMQKFKQDE